jgi:deazaflavin-dependent oxidoreductase (nitroreductase family)
MPLPGWLARYNRRVTNHLAAPLAAWMPGFGIVLHRGRRSGRPYRTPVNLFRSGDAYVIALTYGRRRDWVRNVVAASGCRVLTRGVVLRLGDPRIVVDESLARIPRIVRPVLRAIGASAYMVLAPVPAESATIARVDHA